MSDIGDCFVTHTFVRASKFFPENLLGQFSLSFLYSSRYCTSFIMGIHQWYMYFLHERISLGYLFLNYNLSFWENAQVKIRSTTGMDYVFTKNVELNRIKWISQFDKERNTSLIKDCVFWKNTSVFVNFT